MSKLIILKLSFLFIAVLYTISNILKTCYKNEIPPGMVFLQAIGIVGFAILQFGLYK